jgi:hypothetical protein
MMKLPDLKDTLIVEDQWTPDSECPDELILRNQNGDAWSVSIMHFNYMHTESKANKLHVTFKEVNEGEE